MFMNTHTVYAKFCKMTFYNHVTCICLVSLIIVSLTKCSIDETEYDLLSEWNDKMCPVDDLIFSVTTRCVIECLNLCTRSSDCTSVFYNTESLTCDGCLFQSSGLSLLNDQQGTVCYTKRLSSDTPIPCGQPPTVNNIVYRQYILTAPTGYQIAFICDPCTYFVPYGQSTRITCLANGTWTTPVCVNAVDSGYFADGSPVPPDAKGCVSTYGGNCGSSVNSGYVISGGRRNCFCDAVCCHHGDCCFDSNC